MFVSPSTPQSPGSNVGEFDGHSRRVLSCTFKPTIPFRIVTCGEDFLVNFYEGPPFKFKLSSREHSNFVNRVRFAPDGSKFISVSSDEKGEIVTSGFDNKLAHIQKWWDLAAFAAILVSYRLLFFVVLKLKERAGPALKAIQAKRTMKNLDRRPSFKRMPSLSLLLSSMSSRRHQPIRSLSSQEGLNSPIHY